MGTNVLLPENSITIIQGSSKTLQLTVTDSHNKPVDLTGATLYFTVKRHATDPAPLIQKTSLTASQAVITVPRHGVAQIYLLPSDTWTLDPREYIFDVWVILASGNRYPVIQPSVFEVQSSVTIIPA